jgi:Ca-activated chloride channel family protein
MSFKHPIFLLSLLLVAFAVGVWLLAERRRMRYAVRFTNLDVLASVAPSRTWPRYLPPALFVLALSSLFLASARPQVNREVANERATVILVVDTSRSMQAKDVEPTRLGAAQQAVRVFLDKVPKKLRVGLIAFAGEAQVAAPPTTNHGLVRQSVDTIGDFLIYGGTAIGDALQAAVELGKKTIEQNPDGTGPIAAPGGVRTLAASTRPGSCEQLVSILFLSDGAQTRGILQPLEGAQLAKDACFPVYTIALGTPNGTVSRGGYFGGGTPDSGGQVIQVPPDPVTLRQIAQLTGGKFSEARSAKALESAYERLGSSLGRQPGKSEITFVFVGVAAALLLASGLLGAFLSPRIP